MNLRTNNDTKVRVIKAGQREDRVVYEWENGYRLKMDGSGFALYRGNEILADYHEMFTSSSSSSFRQGYRG